MLEELALAPARHLELKDGRFAARLDRAAAYQLLQQVDPGEGSRPTALVVGGRRYPVPGL